MNYIIDVRRVNFMRYTTEMHMLFSSAAFNRIYAGCDSVLAFFKYKTHRNIHNEAFLLTRYEKKNPT